MVSRTSTTRLPLRCRPGRSAAFTIIELIAVLVIVGVLASLAFAGYKLHRDRTWERRTETELLATFRHANTAAANDLRSNWLADVDFIDEAAGTPPTAPDDRGYTHNGQRLAAPILPSSEYEQQSLSLWRDVDDNIEMEPVDSVTLAMMAPTGRCSVLSAVNGEVTELKTVPLSQMPDGECGAYASASVVSPTGEAARERSREYGDWQVVGWSYDDCEAAEGGEDETQCLQRTRSVTPWSSWSNGSYVWSGCSPEQNLLDEQQCQRRTRGWNSWSSWSSYAWSSCTSSTSATGTQRQCQPRTRTWNSWSTGSWAWANCTTSSSGSLQEQCQTRTRGWNSWSSWSSYAWSGCTGSQSSTSTQRQCQRRSRGWNSWSSLSSYSYSSCSASQSSTSTQRQCRARTRTRSTTTVYGSWSGWSNTNSCPSTTSTRQCRLGSAAYGYQTVPSCSGSTPGGCQIRTRSSSTGYTAWSGWSYGSTGFSSCSATNGTTTQRQCASRTRTRASWSAQSANYSSCSATASSATGTQYQCRSRTRTRASWTASGWSSSSNCSATASSATGTQRQCVKRTRSRSGWTTGTAGHSSCSATASSYTGATQRQCRARERTRASWTQHDRGYTNCSATASSEPATQAQCRPVTRTRGWNAWVVNPDDPEPTYGSCTAVEGEETEEQCFRRDRTVDPWPDWPHWYPTQGCSPVDSVLYQRECTTTD